VGNPALTFYWSCHIALSIYIYIYTLLAKLEILEYTDYWSALFFVYRVPVRIAPRDLLCLHDCIITFKNMMVSFVYIDSNSHDLLNRVNFSKYNIAI